MGVLDQFEHPHGTPGRLVGWILTWANRSINERLVAELTLRGDERVLEIGYGPGVALEMMAAKLPRGSLSGVDPSETMRSQAERRNEKSLRQGRMVLSVGDSAHLPYADTSFDIVYTANNVQLWSPFPQVLSEVHRVLRPGGRIAIAVQGVAARAQAGPLGGNIDELDRSLRAALSPPGWRDYRPKVQRLWTGRALFAIAVRGA